MKFREEKIIKIDLLEIKITQLYTHKRIIITRDKILKAELYIEDTPNKLRN